MESINFRGVLPQVFAHRSDLGSDIWENDVNFKRGHLYLIEADSGKGKSTFCSYMIGYRHDYSGQICFDGRDVAKFSVRDWVDVRKSHISMLFQELRLFPELTAMENVEIKNRITGFKPRGEIAEWFDQLGIADKIDTPVGRMSFGQQQRVAMMRALAQPFDFLLADEPISHLDDGNAQTMGEIMTREARRQGAAIILTSIGKHIDLPYETTYHL